MKGVSDQGSTRRVVNHMSDHRRFKAECFGGGARSSSEEQGKHPPTLSSRSTVCRAAVASDKGWACSSRTVKSSSGTWRVLRFC